MKYFETSRQAVDLRGISLLGRILDIGGGGEGIISQHSGNGVVAIDARKEELEETPDIGLKIVMNACDLKFLDKSFDHITCFFSLMYMSRNEIEIFFKEAHRVLRDDGYLWIWDVTIPYPAQSDVFVAQLEVMISDTLRVSTGYGIAWTRAHSLEILQATGGECSFTPCEKSTTDETFFLRMRKLDSVFR